MDHYQPTISFPLEHSVGRDSKVLTFDIYFARRNDSEPSRSARSNESNWYCVNVRPPPPPILSIDIPFQELPSLWASALLLNRKYLLSLLPKV